MLTRRRFLAGVGAAAAAAPFVSSSAAWAQGAEPDHTLVVVFLRGGMDGLSAVPPLTDGRYFDRRPTIAVPAHRALPLSSELGLHPSLGALLPHWQSGNLAVIPACGSDFDSRSHFDQQDQIERGGAFARNGWLTRHLASRPQGAADTLESVSITGHTPASLSGPSNTIASRHLTDLRLEGFWDDLAGAARSGLEAMYAESHSSLLATTAPTTFDALDQIAAADPANASSSVTYPETDFALAMREIARLVRSGLAPDVATVDMQGWDTHDEMGSWSSGTMVDLLRELGNGLDAFARDLGPTMDRVSVVVMSEFGRRVQENGNNGCDHGRGGVMFALGNRIAGGVHGDWPTVADAALDRGDVAVANDYRDVLGELVVDLLGNERVGDVFPNHMYRPLGIVA